MPDRPHLSIDPAVQFGRVCVPGTRIPADALSGCVAGGDSVDAVAADYEVSRKEVLLCCWWAVMDALSQRRPTVYEKSLRNEWRDWANKAQWVMGGHADGVIPDPPVISRR